MRAPRYRLRLLGGSGIETENGGSAGLAAQRHPIALAAILAVEAGNPVARDKLVALLWPDFDAERARNRLRVTLHALREAFGREAFVSVTDGLRIDATRISCDLLEFAGALQAGDAARAVRAYAGPFLDGFHLPDSVEFDQWADGQRDRLAREYRDALEQLAQRCTAAGELAAAAEWWRRRVREEPFSGRAVVRLMEALERAGDPAAALRAEETYARLLRDEFDTAPAPEVVALAARIREAPQPAPAPPPREQFVDQALATVINEADETAPPTSPPERGQRAQWRSTRRVSRPKAAAGVFLSVAVAFLTLRLFGIIGDRTLMAAGEPVARHPIVLADFRALNADSSLARVVTEALRVDLTQSSVVTLADRARAREVLAAMRRPAGAPLDEETAREVAIRLGSKAVVGGEIGRAGLGYLLTARVVSADSGRELASFRATARDAGALVASIEKLSHDVRARAGESLRSVRASEPLAMVTTSSLPALRKWAEAVYLERAGGDRARAIRLVEEATALDPEFAMAWWWLAVLHLNDNRRASWLYATERAVAAADRLTERERHEVRWNYALATGDFATAEAELRELRPTQWNNLSGVAWYRGDFEKAEEYAQRSLQFADSAGRVAGWVTYWNLAVAQMDLGKVAQARATAEASVATGSGVHQNLLWLVDMVEGRYADAAARAEDAGVARRSQTDFMRGRIDAARLALERRVSRGEVRPLVAEVALALADFFILGQNRSLDGVERLVRDTLPEWFNEQLLAELGVALAMGGRVEAARLARSVYEQRVPREARWQDVHLLEAINAFIALHNGRSSVALAALYRGRKATPWTAPVDALLGHAYERLGAADSAIAAYSRYIDTPWAYRGGPYGWLSDPWLLVPIHERLSILLIAAGQREAAAHHAQRVTEIWSDADPELQPRVRVAARLLQGASTRADSSGGAHAAHAEAAPCDWVARAGPRRHAIRTIAARCEAPIRPPRIWTPSDPASTMRAEEVDHGTA